MSEHLKAYQKLKHKYESIKRHVTALSLLVDKIAEDWSEGGYKDDSKRERMTINE